MKISLDLV